MNQHLLWYRTQATRFEEALPIGAGRFGCMCYGGITTEKLTLNEDSVWSGGMRNRCNPDAYEGFQEVRALLKAGRIHEAETISMQKMQGCGPNMPHYMPFGTLHIGWNVSSDTISNYRRSLDLSTAMQTTAFTCDGYRFCREILASAPAQVIAIHLTAERPFTCEASLDGRDDYFDHNQIIRTPSGKALLFTGGTGGKQGISFAASVQVRAENGSIGSYGNTLTVTDTTDATYVISMRTSYYHPNTDLTALACADTTAAIAQTWKSICEAHLADYRALYDRVEVCIPHEPSDMPTDMLLSAVQQDQTSTSALCTQLLLLFFRFGRYLMIAGSRPGSLPLNLQGIWNEDMWPAWGSRFTININTEMNYWCAESCGLSECHAPLFDLIERMRENGREIAHKMYGCEGFCAHHNTDLWGDCAPQDLWIPATIWPMGAAWMCLHLYEHFCYTQDIAFLREKYPTLREAALFFTQYLTENAQGQLVTGPSISPENTYRQANGEQGNLCMGPSMDSQMITALYEAVIASARILGEETDFVALLKSQLERLPKPQIGRYGQIMEWAVDYDEVEPGHRHVSQLFALHPAHQISPRKTPALAKAAEATLLRRNTQGSGHTGWSRAWIANFCARLQKGDEALQHLIYLLQHSTNSNLFDMHPPFQIDGNFGGTAAVAEMLLQSDAEGMTLLPACPTAWHSGSFRGLCAYGGFIVSASWSDHTLQSAVITSNVGGTCRIFTKYSYHVSTAVGSFVPTRKEANGSLIFETVAHGEYHLMKA